MRFLGIDYGTKRIGIAISDENGTLAFPKGLVPNDLNAFKVIGDILKKENISEVVVGESLDLKGSPNPLFKEIKIFVQELQSKFNLPIHMEREFLTSVEARRKEGKGKNNARKVKKQKSVKVDASAAALILQRYLDKINLQK
ncbi:Holliday junction resolvase RuvX [Patescibacteria group bacterium]|nr:Holliday junction resolvase RuvX [Patescibacteria group bacterium]MBU1728133.1 Holliday junction resolvase RuvX [Patescibacteria group bacterium]